MHAQPGLTISMSKMYAPLLLWIVLSVQHGHGTDDMMKCQDEFQFACSNGECVSTTMKCNGINDCGDWSDEDAPTCECEDGWLQYQGRCYMVNVKEKITWQKARFYCKESKANLTTILSREHEEFILQNLPNNTQTMYVGLQKNYVHAPGTFKNVFLWDDQSPLIYQNWLPGKPDGGTVERCVLMNGTNGLEGWDDVFCGKHLSNVFVCMKNRKRHYNRPELQNSTSEVNTNLLMKCDNGELRSKFRTCDGRRDCRDNSDEELCENRVTCGPDKYRCNNRRCVSLTFYCDGTDDCGDNTDESRCIMKPCDSTTEWKCKNGQCIPRSQRCDHNLDCFDKTDESDCETCSTIECIDGQCVPETWIGDGSVDCNGGLKEDEDVSGAKYIEFQKTNFTVTVPKCTYLPDSHGKVKLNFSNDCVEYDCPNTYFKCPNSYCIPVFMVCNGFYDCPGAEEERDCGLAFSEGGFSCPGYYRCYRQGNCIDPSHVCDGIRHCLHGDDERYCSYSCPPNCTCWGREIKCDQIFPVSPPIPEDVRKLDLSGLIENGTFDFHRLYYLTVLNVSRCGLSDIAEMFQNLHNLIDLDLRYNLLQSIRKETFSTAKRLRFLDLSHNELLTDIEVGTFNSLSKLEKLNLFNTGLEYLGNDLFFNLENLEVLNLSSSRINNITNTSLSDLKRLEVLDIRRTSAERIEGFFLKSLMKLEILYTDSYHLCCETRRPGSPSLTQCKISKPPFTASCENLLGQESFRITVWTFGGVAALGAVLVLLYRYLFERKTYRKYYGIYFTNLTVSDFLMGLYLMFIATADMNRKGFYESVDHEWRHSFYCQAAGAVALLSSEASIMFICLITFDRYIKLRYPFGRIRFSNKTTTVCVLGTWILAVVIAGIPLLPPLQHWEFYSRNSICMALPPFNEDGPVWMYSATIFVGVNFSICVFTGVILISIYRKLSSLSDKRMGRRAGADEKSSTQLFFVLFTDFFCWFFVGCMAIEALRGKLPNRDVYVWALVGIIPMNAALNPLVYMLSSMLEAWSDSRKPKGAAYNPQEFLIPHDTNLDETRVFVGNPTRHMTTVKTVMDDRKIPFVMKCGISSIVIAFLFDLKDKRKHYEEVNYDNIFAHRSEGTVQTLCLSLATNRHRLTTGDDVLYLMNMLCEKREAQTQLEQIRALANGGTTKDGLYKCETRSTF